eukprot:jgi/Picsp_1/2796/NSC_01022-R1_r-snare vamp72-family
MPLIYSFVARGTTVLADYTAYTGNFSVIAIQALEKGSQGNNAKFTYSCDGHTFNYLSSQGYTFLAVADEAYGRTIPFAFVEKVRDEWFAKWADKGASASAHSLDKSFGARLRYWMEYCETHPDDISKAAAVQKKVDEVKGIMVENIERVLERGEKIELLVDKTDNLRFQADKFHKTGRNLRNKMWWQNFKVQLIVLLVVILIAVIIFASVCFSGGNCLK